MYNTNFFKIAVLYCICMFILPPVLVYSGGRAEAEAELENNSEGGGAKAL